VNCLLCAMAGMDWTEILASDAEKLRATLAQTDTQ
jgi:hypothetical protein